jgi:hypothetical protein
LGEKKAAAGRERGRAEAVRVILGLRNKKEKKKR